MKITSDLTNLTTAILILTGQMFFEWTLYVNTTVKDWIFFFILFINLIIFLRWYLLLLILRTKMNFLLIHRFPRFVFFPILGILIIW
jgi:hypothetical protein